jgi:hypothetical protein
VSSEKIQEYTVRNLLDETLALSEKAMRVVMDTLADSEVKAVDKAKIALKVIELAQNKQAGDGEARTQTDDVLLSIIMSNNDD